ncbi:MAG: hypothetical protein LBQ93_11650 [Treponema sp.]|nr:hypothetical protein [Treponema sp.]
MNSAKLLVKITEKWSVKVLSLAVALIIFVFHWTTNTVEERSFRAPLSVESNERLIPVSSFVDTVSLNIKWETGTPQSIFEEDIEAYIDLGKYTKEGTYKVPVQTRIKGSAVGVEPLQIRVSPVEILLQLEEKTNRIIPVFPVLQGTIAQDYELTRQLIIPETVVAEGSRRVLDSQSEFYTDTIDLEGRFEDIIVYVNIINTNPYITIHGSNMIEYHGTIRRIEREAPMPDSAAAEEDDDETGDNGQ